MELTKPGLDILQPAWKDRAPASVDALFTCRDGGVSSGAYGNAEGIMGLNVAPHTGDFGACVRMNRSIVAQLVPSDPVWLRQGTAPRSSTPTRPKANPRPMPPSPRSRASSARS